MTAPSFNVSPSQAKIFSTRPPVRDATWTSSTSIVPETVSVWRLHPAKSGSAIQAVTQRMFGNEFANCRRIDRLKSCATLCAGNARKGNAWLFRNPSGAEAWGQARAEGGYD